MESMAVYFHVTMRWRQRNNFVCNMKCFISTSGSDIMEAMENIIEITDY